VAVLLRACRLGPRLPEPLAAFLRDPRHTLLGFGWDGSDELKMRSTYGCGAEELFGGGGGGGEDGAGAAPAAAPHDGSGATHSSGGSASASALAPPLPFLDLQVVAEHLGYPGIGLARLTGLVLGATPHKNRAVATSNWEAGALSRAQVKYAALDVLVAGGVYRGLRLWHASPAPCASCRVPLGGWPAAAALASEGDDTGRVAAAAAAAAAAPVLVCALPCGRSFSDARAYMSHCAESGHVPTVHVCSACGRVVSKGD
jgi:hypothetical protein